MSNNVNRDNHNLINPYANNNVNKNNYKETEYKVRNAKYSGMSQDQLFSHQKFNTYFRNYKIKNHLNTSSVYSLSPQERESIANSFKSELILNDGNSEMFRNFDGNDRVRRSITSNDETYSGTMKRTPKLFNGLQARQRPMGGDLFGNNKTSKSTTDSDKSQPKKPESAPLKATRRPIAGNTIDNSPGATSATSVTAPPPTADIGDYYTGMYSSTSNEIFETENMDNIDQLVREGDRTDVYGRPIQDQFESYNPYTDDSGPKTRILGLPLMYNNLADPDGRIFNETIMRSLPLVYMTPGKAKLNKKLIDETGKKMGKSDIIKMLSGADDNDEMAGTFAIRNPRSGNDIRFAGFQRDFSEYVKYVSLLCSVVHSLMGLGGCFSWAKSVGDASFDRIFNNTGLCFYVDRATSISESSNNEYGESIIGQTANDMSAKAREVRTLFGSEADLTTYEAKSASQIADDLFSDGGLFGRLKKGAKRVLNGSQLLYPMIWQDSKFDRPYNISLKFYSPYGDKESIFKFVYLPFLAVLALALP